MHVSLEEQVVAAKGRQPDPAFAGLSDQVLVEGFAREASVIAASTCRWLRMLAEIVRRGAWVEDGATSPAPELDGIMVRYAGAASGQQLKRICAQFVTSDTGPVADTWAARDLSMR